MSYIFQPIYSGIDTINAECQFIQKKGAASYIYAKLQERNPFSASREYKKECKALKKRVAVLKQIKKRFTTLWRERHDPAMEKKVVKLSKRIKQLEARLHYLHTDETGQALLKCVAPCNFIIPGSGDFLRVTAYTLKFINAAFYYAELRSLDEVKNVTKAITLANVTSVATQYIYQHVKSLREYFTYPNFRALFIY